MSSNPRSHSNVAPGGAVGEHTMLPLEAWAPVPGERSLVVSIKPCSVDVYPHHHTGWCLPFKCRRIPQSHFPNYLDTYRKGIPLNMNKERRFSIPHASTLPGPVQSQLSPNSSASDHSPVPSPYQGAPGPHHGAAYRALLLLTEPFLARA